MKILMLSIDKGLLGQGQLGDVVERHKKYGEFCDRLDIIVLCKKGYEKNKISDKVTVYPTNSLTRYNFFCDAYKIGKKLFLENKYQLVIGGWFSGLSAWWLKKKFKTKLLLTFHGDFWQNRAGLQSLWHNYFLLFISKFLMRRADGIRVVSEGLKSKLVKMGMMENKIRAIPTPMDLSRFENYQDTEIWSDLREKAADSKIVLMGGRKDAVKDFDTLFNALNLVYEKDEKVCLWLVGNYNNFEEIKEKIKLPKEQVGCFGMVKTGDLPAYYKTADLFVSSSKSESLGKMSIEANACGKPVISTATTGAKEIIQDGVNGFLVPIGDAKKMAEKIIYLLNNPELAKQMGENGRKIVMEKYSDNLSKIINFWKELVCEE
jgi:glycosyltransferase involved in cell wall biosynthesis